MEDSAAQVPTHAAADEVQRTLTESAARVDEIERAFDAVRVSLQRAREERRAAVAAARLAGVSYGEIGAALGVTPQRARALAADAVFAARRGGMGRRP